jgi:chaperonin cofactor prefoldin
MSEQITLNPKGRISSFLRGAAPKGAHGVLMAASLLGCLIATNVVAQVQRSGGGGGAANAQLMMQYQQASAERTQLQADNAKLKKDLEDLKKQLDAANKLAAASKAGVSRGASELAAAQAANERSTKDLADSKAKMQELIGKFRETITQMRGIEAEKTQLQQQLTQSKDAFDKCAERNYALYEVNNEVLDRYAHEGAFGHMARAEPFTRIKRTQIDNYVLEYKERAEELRMQKATPPPGAAPAPPAPPAPSTGGAPGANAGPAPPPGAPASHTPPASPGPGASPPPASPEPGASPLPAPPSAGATSASPPPNTPAAPAQQH